MKKRILSLMLALLMIAALFPVMSATAFAASSTSVFAAKNEAAGLGGDVSISFNSSNKGNLYLPGEVNTDACFLRWTGEGVALASDGTAYESGTAPIAPAGGSVSYTIDSVKYTVTTVQGSPYVEGLFLNIDESMGTIKAMNSDKSHETSCYGTLSFDGDEYYMSIKGRGNSTWDADKKPYNITFYKKADFDKKKSVSLISGTEAKKWSLLANDVDPSLLRNKIGLDYANELGIGLPSRFADVWINGEYIGNYLLTPKNDYQASDTGFVLEIDNYSNKEDPQFKPDGLLEIGVSDGYFNRITVKDIGEDAAIDANGIKAWVNEAWDAILDYDSDEYLNYIDMDSWAKMYLVYEITKTYDSYSGSLLMHRDGTSPEDKLIAGPAWDLDNCLGRIKPKTLQFIGLLPQISADGWFVDDIGLTISSLPLSWLQELGKHADFMARVYEIYNETTSASYNLCMNIDTQANILGASAEMNGYLWDYTGLFATNYTISAPLIIGVGDYTLRYKTTDEWSDFVDNLSEYVSTRMKFLYDNLLVVKPEGSISGNTELKDGDKLTLTANVSNASGSLSYQWQNSSDGESWQNIAGATSKIYSAVVSAESDGMSYRCIVKGTKAAIRTVHVATVQPSVSSVFSPVTITVAEKKAPMLSAKSVSVNADVKVTKTSSSSLLGKLFKIYNYTAVIDVNANGVDVKSVQYSTNNKTWKNGTEYSKTSNISTLYVRVTDTNGTVYNFLYSNGTTSKI